MEIRSLDNQWVLTFTAIEAETSRLPGLQVTVQLQGEFSAVAPNVHYEFGTLKNFVTALKRLENSRSGDAWLDSLSPGECSLRVECVGALGNVLLHVDICRVLYFPQAKGHTNNSVSVTFEVDRELLGRTISEFSGLVEACRPGESGP